MLPPRPRIVVSSATFDSFNPPEDFSGRASPTNSDLSSNLSSKTRRRPSTTGERHNKTRSWTQSVSEWAYEIVWCLVSIVLLMALVIVLSVHNQRPLPEFPLGLTLNTITAILATASRSVAMLIISEGVSQLKWNWFANTSRPLVDLGTFDMASRGPWGSLQLLFSTRGK